MRRRLADGFEPNSRQEMVIGRAGGVARIDQIKLCAKFYPPQTTPGVNLSTPSVRDSAYYGFLTGTGGRHGKDKGRVLERNEKTTRDLSRREAFGPFVSLLFSRGLGMP
jgi:hypothetical protein